MIVLFLLIQIVLSINTNQIIFLNDINEIRISGEGSIKQNDFKEYKEKNKEENEEVIRLTKMLDEETRKAEEYLNENIILIFQKR